MPKAFIKSCGAYVPENIITNQYFDDYLQINVSDWLENTAQIYERRWISEGQTTSDLATEAGQQCLTRADISPEDVDLLIVATDTPDYISPSTASVTQDKMGCINAGTFDLNSACAGFVTGLDVGSKYIATDSNYQNVLVIGAYTMSRFLNKYDKKTVTLFADGAGAILLQSASEDESFGFKHSELRTMGQYNKWMGVYGGGSHQPAHQSEGDSNNYYLQFVKKFPSEINPNTWSEMAIELNKKGNVNSGDVDKYFITQINVNSLYETMDILKVPRDKAYSNMHYNGYTGSACIPLAFNDAWENKAVKKGDLVYFIGSGGGLAFASTSFVL